MTNYGAAAISAGSALADVIVPHPAFEGVLQYVLNAIQVGNQAGIFTGVRVTAPAGGGKTLLMSYLGDILRRGLSDTGSVPLISASLKEDPSVSQIQGDLLAKFSYAMASSIQRSRGRANNNDVNQILVSAIKHQGVKVVVLDEFQHVYYSSGTKVATPVIDWLKRLINATGVPVVLLGTEMMDSLGAIDPQLTSRVPVAVKLAHFRLGPEWLGFLKGLADTCKATDLTPSYKNKEWAGAIFRATSGSPRLLKALLVQAVLLAVEKEKPSLSAELLRQAYSLQTGASSNEENPFASL
ncbi:TniB family NTP-binding protein [Achromobacter spanius]|uniref:TniB family NTP-binding protein n=1 Tax=Achromobacter spanius TaxID=217203 RepID=UPI0036E930AD